jgi:DNA polymerase III alpha subunit (gram-positive type)
MPSFKHKEAAMAQKVYIDMKTSGISPSRGEIIELCALKPDVDLMTYEMFHAYIKTCSDISEIFTEIEGISKEMLDEYGVPIEDAIARFDMFIFDCEMVSFVPEYDLSFLKEAYSKCGLIFNNKVVNVIFNNKVVNAVRTGTKETVPTGKSLDEISNYLKVPHHGSESTIKACEVIARIHSKTL